MPDATHHPEIQPVPAVIEPTAVQLARMEGVLNLVAFQVTDIVKRVDKHEEKIVGHGSRIQSLEDGAVADKETAVALALALKDAKEQQEATINSENAKAAAQAKEAETKAALGWSPVTKVFAVGTFLFGLIATAATVVALVSR